MKLHFTTLNYAPDYTLHHKLFKCILYTINYHTLHPSVTLAVTFDGILLHMTSMCFFLRRNKLKRRKHSSLKSIKKNLILSTSLYLVCIPLPNSYSSQNLSSHPTHLTHCPIPLFVSRGWDNPLYFSSNAGATIH